MAPPSWRTRGQPVALAAIQRALRQERPPQALLLLGPAHVGKTTLALDLAAALLCTAQQAEERPCRACPACRQVGHRAHPDLHLLAPAGAGQQIRLGARVAPEPGTVRALLAEFALRPMTGRHRIVIVEQAQRLNEDAQNALLKLLEEPPEGAVVCLAADDAEPLIDTLRSRCATLRLGTVPLAAITELLLELGLAEPLQASVIARASAGLPGRAASLAQAPEALLAEERLVRRLLDLLAVPVAERLAAAPGLREDGLTAATWLDPVAKADGPGLAEASSAVDEAGLGETAAEPDDSPGRRNGRGSPQQRRAAVRGVLAVWADLGRDLAVAKAGDRAAVRRVDLLEELGQIAPAVRGPQLITFLARLEGLDRAVESYADPELVLDTLLLAWPPAARAA